MKIQSNLQFACPFVLMVLTNCSEMKKEMNPPIAAQKPKELVMHGDVRKDLYYWLNDRENPEVIAYLEAENAYQKEMMKATEGLQEELFTEIKSRIKEDDDTAPYLSNGYYYFTKYEKGKEYPIYCRYPSGNDKAIEVILDVNVLAEGHAYYQVGNFEVSPDNAVMAFCVDTVSRRQYSVYIKDLKTGKITETTIKNTNANITWMNDNQTLVYVENNPQTLRSEKVYALYHEKDETFYTYVHRSITKKYLFVHSSSTVSSESRYTTTDDLTFNFKVFQKRERNLEYSVEDGGDGFYIHTNMGAKNFKIAKTSYDKTDKSNWVDVQAGSDKVFVEGMNLTKNYMVVSERENGLTRLKVVNRATGTANFIQQNDETYTLYSGTNEEYESLDYLYGYTSLTTPSTTYKLNLKTQQKEIVKQQEIPGGYDLSSLESKRLFAKANDGTLIPISIVYKKGKGQGSKQSLLLYGYGSYGYSMDASFSVSRLSLLDRGFAFAIAHIRGGQEMGRAWYENGKMLNKKNTFTDFINCAEFLVQEKYTTPEHLFAMGGSAGGLLMGAISNMRPDLFKGIVAQVPFVDVVTTMLDESIPLTTGEYDEWGNPNDSTYYHYIKSYSPYDNVVAQDYPAMLITTGLHDSQVQYWEPAKWIAKLRTLNTGKAPIMMYCNMDTGHGGASGRFERFKEIAMEYAFIIQQNSGGDSF
jgi:oligopeptidase B